MWWSRRVRAQCSPLTLKRQLGVLASAERRRLSCCEPGLFNQSRWVGGESSRFTPFIASSNSVSEHPPIPLNSFLSQVRLQEGVGFLVSCRLTNQRPSRNSTPPFSGRRSPLIKASVYEKSLVAKAIGATRAAKEPLRAEGNPGGGEVQKRSRDGRVEGAMWW